MNDQEKENFRLLAAIAIGNAEKVASLTKLSLKLAEIVNEASPDASIHLVHLLEQLDASNDSTRELLEASRRLFGLPANGD